MMAKSSRSWLWWLWRSNVELTRQKDKHSHSLNGCKICVDSQTPGDTCPSASCLATPLEVMHECYIRQIKMPHYSWLWFSHSGHARSTYTWVAHWCRIKSVFAGHVKWLVALWLLLVRHLVRWSTVARLVTAADARTCVAMPTNCR